MGVGGGDAKELPGRCTGTRGTYVFGMDEANDPVCADVITAGFEIEVGEREFCVLVSEMAGYGRGGRPWIVFPPVGVVGAQSARIVDIVGTSFDMSALPLLVRPRCGSRCRIGKSGSSSGANVGNRSSFHRVVCTTACDGGFSVSDIGSSNLLDDSFNPARWDTSATVGMPGTPVTGGELIRLEPAG